MFGIGKMVKRSEVEELKGLVKKLDQRTCEHELK